MATAREGNPYEGGGLGAGGKFRKRPFRRTQTTPYDRPPTALRNPSTSRNDGWFSKLVDPAQRLIASSAHRLFSSVFRKRLPPPPPPPSLASPPPNPPPSETEQEVRDNHQEAAAIQSAVGESDNQMNWSDSGGFSELEKLLKQKTFTRSEIDHLTALLHSKTVDSPVTEEKRAEVVTSELMLSHEQKEDYPHSAALRNGINDCPVSTPFVSSSVIDKDVASPAEVAKAYMESRPSTVSSSKLNSQSLAIREDSTLLNSQYFPPKSPVMSIVPRATSHDRLHENGYMMPRSRGRSAIYSMARTPYTRVYPASTLKGGRLPVQAGPSTSAQSALDHDILSGSKKGALKRRSSVLDSDIGSVGPMRRIRQKPNLLTSRGLSSSVTGSPLSIVKSGVHADSAQRPSSIMQKPLLLSEAKHSDKKLSAENVDDTMPSTSLPLISSKSSEMASKILQQLDKLVSPKEKSSELKLPTISDKSPTKLSPSMLRGQALRSMETLDSSKFLDNMRDNNSDGLHENLSADAEKLSSQKDKLENGPLKLVAHSVGLVPDVTDAEATVTRKEIATSAKSMDSSMTKSVSNPPQKRRAFHMSAHEDYLDLDDDVYPNGAASSLPTENEMKDSTVAAEKTAGTEMIAQEKPPASSVAIPLKNSRIDDQTLDGTGDRSIIGEKVDVSTSITSSTPGLTFKPVGVTAAAATMSTFGSDISSLLNGSVAASPPFNFGNKVASSTESTVVDAPSKELSKPGPIFSFGDKVLSSKDASTPLFNFGANKNVDKVQQMPLTSSSVGAESAGLKFGASSDSKLGNSISSTIVAGATDSVPKVPESDNADPKTNTDTGSYIQSSKLAVSSAASTSLLTSPTSIFSFGHSSNQSNGPPASKTSFSSPFPTLVSNNFTSQNMFSCSSSGASSSNAATVASTGSSMTTTTPVIIASNSDSNSNSSSSSVAASSSSTPSFFKFGSSPVLTTGLPASSSGKQDAGFSIVGSSTFGSSSSAAVGSTGNSIFGLSTSAMTTVNSQSQGFVFGSSTSVPDAQASPATSGFATSMHSQSSPFGSSASSPLFGLSSNTAFSSGSPMFSSSSATNVFNSGTSFGLSTSAASSAANTASSDSGTSSSLFGLSSWQPSKSPFGSTFSSSSSGFSFGVSSGSVASTTSSSIFGSSTVSVPSTTSSPSPMFGSSTSSLASTTGSFMFGSSTGSLASTTSSPMFGSSSGASSSPMFSFTSAAGATSTQPVFGSPNAGFTFGSAATVNNDQMSMEDSMAEDTVQASPVAPVFGQQAAPPQSNFVFGASAPSGASPFQFGSQQNIAPQNPSPFQASSSLEFNAGGSFSLGTGGVDKSGRKFVKVSKHRARKK